MAAIAAATACALMSAGHAAAPPRCPKTEQACNSSADERTADKEVVYLEGKLREARRARRSARKRQRRRSAQAAKAQPGEPEKKDAEKTLGEVDAAMEEMMPREGTGESNVSGSTTHTRESFKARWGQGDGCQHWQKEVEGEAASAAAEREEGDARGTPEPGEEATAAEDHAPWIPGNRRRARPSRPTCERRST